MSMKTRALLFEEEEDSRFSVRSKTLISVRPTLCQLLLMVKDRHRLISWSLEVQWWMLSYWVTLCPRWARSWWHRGAVIIGDLETVPRFSIGDRLSRRHCVQIEQALPRSGRSWESRPAWRNRWRPHQDLVGLYPSSLAEDVSSIGQGLGVFVVAVDDFSSGEALSDGQ